MNVYEDTVVRSRMEMSECSKTEDVYQTLHRPPAVSIPNSTHEPVRPRRLKTMLPIFNTLLLVAIVVMLGLHVAKEPRSTEANNPQASGSSAGLGFVPGVVEGNKREELWRLHDDVFYLFWEAEGNCTAAVKFCEDRNSEVVTIRNSEGQNTEGSGHSDYGYMDFYFNTNPDLLDWILSQANGRKLWINIVGVTTTHLNESLYHCPPDDENSDTMQGWVCESPQRSNFGFFHRKLFRDHFFLDTPTELPESSASTAVSVHSVKVYVTTASVLSLLCPLRCLSTL